MIDIPFAPPLVIHRETVRPDWIDYNGHMNVAFYVMAFDHATDGLFDVLGIGAAYCQRENRSVFAVEQHIAYKRELKRAKTWWCPAISSASTTSGCTSSSAWPGTLESTSRPPWRAWACMWI